MELRSVLNQPLPDHKREFILSNAGKMKQKEIAELIGVTPACVCKILKQSGNGFFNVDEFAKHYAI